MSDLTHLFITHFLFGLRKHEIFLSSPDSSADVPRTFPENTHFGSGGNSGTQDYSCELRKVLRAFAAATPKIGYCQGLNFVAAEILLIVKDAEKAFWLLEYLVKEVVPFGYYTQDMAALKRDCDVLACLVK